MTTNAMTARPKNLHLITTCISHGGIARPGPWISKFA